MFEVIRRKARTLARFVWPNAGNRHYLATIRASGLFDAAWYREVHGAMHPLFARAPMRHYVVHGEAIGLMPCRSFSPRSYLFHNPDLAACPGLRPFRHYIETGRAEGRRVFFDPGHPPPPGSAALGPPVPDLPVPDLPLSDLPGTDPALSGPVAVVLHLHYPELWPDLSRRLAAQRFAFDLLVTLGPPAAGLAREIVHAHPGARVWAVPNHGRDLWPFLMLVRAGLLSPYAAVCKLHGKRSPHRADGDAWRSALIEGVLGAPDRTARRLASFRADPAARLWAADGQIVAGRRLWGQNRARTVTLLARVGLAPREPLCFPMGSIYWLKPALIADLARLDLAAEDFEPEQGLVDGTTAHALERAIGTLAESGRCDPQGRAGMRSAGSLGS